MNSQFDGEKLTLQIAQICDVNRKILSQMAREAAQIEEDWTVEYAEYQSGGWKTLSLYNLSGRPGHTIIAGGLGLETTLLDSMPVTREYLRQLGLKYMAVRLAKLEPKAFLWEHRDYTELDNQERVRLHIPLKTNPSSHFVFPGAAIHMKAGHIWMLDPTERHGACNLGHESRVHLLIDVYVNDRLRNLMHGRKLNFAEAGTVLPRPDLSTLQRELEQAMTFVRLGYRQSAEALLLKAFHKYDLYEGQAYQLIIEMYDQLNESEYSSLWLGRKNRFLGRSADGALLNRKAVVTEQT